MTPPVSKTTSKTEKSGATLGGTEVRAVTPCVRYPHVSKQRDMSRGQSTDAVVYLGWHVLTYKAVNGPNRQRRSAGWACWTVVARPSTLGLRRLVRPGSFRIRRRGWAPPRPTADLRTKILDFRGFDSSIIVVLRGGILMCMGSFPEMLSQAILVGILLVGRFALTPPLPP